jgi:hypothetical protein
MLRQCTLHASVAALVAAAAISACQKTAPPHPIAGVTVPAPNSPLVLVPNNQGDYCRISPATGQLSVTVRNDGRRLYDAAMDRTEVEFEYGDKAVLGLGRFDPGESKELGYDVPQHCWSGSECYFTIRLVRAIPSRRVYRQTAGSCPT